jgi:hypothetical protein
MSFVSKWFWKRAVRHEMLAAAKIVSLVAGLLLIVSALLGGISLVLGLILGLGIIVLGGRLKHRLWGVAFLVLGFIAFSSASGIVAEGAAALVMLAAVLGLASTLT